MALFVKDTSKELEGLVAKRDALTNQIHSVGNKAIQENTEKIIEFDLSILELKRENTEITEVLSKLQ